MIQRKQTLFLLFSIIIMVGYIFTPVVKVIDGAQGHFLYSNNLVFSINVNFPIIGHYFVMLPFDAALVAIGLNVLTILLFKYRNWQVVLCWLTIIPLLISFCYIYYHWSAAVTAFDQYFYFGNISPLVAIVLVFLAMFYIRKDEELVKSVDRLR